MSPPAFRAFFPGVAYQLGNMISAASAQIEATGGDHLKTTVIVKGKPTVVPDYATVQGILIGIVAAFVICVTMVAPEYVFFFFFSSHLSLFVNRNHSSHFENAKAAFEEGAGQDEMEDKIPGAASGASGTKQISDDSHPTSVNEKVSIDRETIIQESRV